MTSAIFPLNPSLIAWQTRGEVAGSHTLQCMQQHAEIAGVALLQVFAGDGGGLRLHGCTILKTLTAAVEAIAEPLLAAVWEIYSCAKAPIK